MAAYRKEHKLRTNHDAGKLKGAGCTLNMWLNFRFRGEKKSRASETNYESYQGLSEILSRLTSVNFFILYSVSCQIGLKGLGLAQINLSSTPVTPGDVLATLLLLLRDFFF